jgi:signal transduction histidine kinase
LLRLTEVGITDLRHYSGGLRHGSSGESILLPAVRRFGNTIGEATGIAVHVEAGDNLHVNDRLAAEVFQMVTEGLSNIRRHTNSTQATIGLTCCNDHLILRMENASAAPASFTPRSLTERATALGGLTRVEWTAGSTAVIIDIPL